MEFESIICITEDGKFINLNGNILYHDLNIETIRKIFFINDYTYLIWYYNGEIFFAEKNGDMLYLKNQYLKNKKIINIMNCNKGIFIVYKINNSYNYILLGDIFYDIVSLKINVNSQYIPLSSYLFNNKLILFFESHISIYQCNHNYDEAITNNYYMDIVIVHDSDNINLINNYDGVYKFFSYDFDNDILKLISNKSIYFISNKDDEMKYLYEEEHHNENCIILKIFDYTVFAKKEITNNYTLFISNNSSNIIINDVQYFIENVMNIGIYYIKDNILHQHTFDITGWQDNIIYDRPIYLQNIQISRKTKSSRKILN